MRYAWKIRGFPNWTCWLVPDPNPGGADLHWKNVAQNHGFRLRQSDVAGKSPWPKWIEVQFAGQISELVLEDVRLPRLGTSEGTTWNKSKSYVDIVFSCWQICTYIYRNTCGFSIKQHGEEGPPSGTLGFSSSSRLGCRRSQHCPRQSVSAQS